MRKAKARHLEVVWTTEKDIQRITEKKLQLNKENPGTAKKLRDSSNKTVEQNYQTKPRKHQQHPSVESQSKYTSRVSINSLQHISFGICLNLRVRNIMHATVI